MNVAIYGASSDDIPKKYIESGERLGECLAERGCRVTFGGGASGLMGAVARGYRRAGGEDLVGIVPAYFNGDGILYDDCTQMIYTETMRERKHRMEERADAFLITPGGIGTMDEFFETLTLRSLDMLDRPIAVLNTDGYYDGLEKVLQTMEDEKFMTEEIRQLAPLFDTPEEAVEDLIRRAEGKERGAEP